MQMSNADQHFPNLVLSHAGYLSDNASVISVDELNSTLNNFVRSAKRLDYAQKLLNINNILIALNRVNSSLLTTIIEHKFFYLLKTSIIELIERWLTASNLEEYELYSFYAINKLLKTLLRHIINKNIYPNWLFDSSLIKTVGSYLKKLSESNSHWNEKNKQQLKTIGLILDIYMKYEENSNNKNSSNNVQFSDLADSVISCIKSDNYIDSFNKMKLDKKSMNSIEKLFLVKCPAFLASYNGPRNQEKTTNLLSTMLTKYTNLLDKLVPSLSEWKRPIIRAVYHGIEILIYGLTDTNIFVNHLQFIDHILKLIDSPIFYNKLIDSLNNVETNLIHRGIRFIGKIISEPAIANHIEQKKMSSTFLRLTSAKYKPLALNVQNILAQTAREDDISTMKDPGDLLISVVKQLKDSAERNFDNQENIEPSLETLKGLVQHDQMKNELLKQNFLPFLLTFMNRFTGKSLALLLEILWALTFSSDGVTILRQNSQLLQTIQEISKTTDNEAIKTATDGLEWKLIREPNMVQKANETNQTIEKTKAANGLQFERTFPYDIMISYCHADKETVHQIHKFLVDEGFKVWIDLNSMFGCAMEAMADAVEKSEFVIMCMSSSYKKSTYCQAEAEYAFKCKRRLLPLIIQPNYMPDGWLGFMIGSRIYVDFGSFDFDTACKKLIHEIGLQLKRPLPSKLASGTAAQIKPTLTAPVPQENNTSTMQVVPYQTKMTNFDFKYTSIDLWTQSDVLNFLFYHNLSEIVPLCEKIDGQGLIKLHEMCASRNHETFSLLNDELISIHKIRLPIASYTRFLSIMEKLFTVTSIPRITEVQDDLPMISMSSEKVALPYDVLVTSNAPIPQMLRMVQKAIPALKFTNFKQ